jgi:hypothetical protein
MGDGRWASVIVEVNKGGVTKYYIQRMNELNNRQVELMIKISDFIPKLQTHIGY